jgi:GT2 family glycosyltransferase/glycosyltransferase involved in cell wall biosynthesis
MTKSENSLVVVTVSFNDAPEIVRLANQLAAQSIQPRALIVVDNAAHDKATNVTQATESITWPFPVTVVESVVNRGFAGGVNAGLSYGQTLAPEYFVVMNADVILDSRLLERCVEVARESQVDFISPIIGRHGNGTVWFAGGQYNRKNGLFGNQNYGESTEVIAEPGEVTPVDWVSGCFMLFRSERLIRLGPLDESLFLYREEVDWQLRARTTALVVREVLMWHEVGGTTGGPASELKASFMARNFLRSAFRHAGKWLPMWLVRFHLYEGIVPLMRADFRRIRSNVIGIRHTFSPPGALLRSFPISRNEASAASFVAVYSPTTDGGLPLYVRTLLSAIQENTHELVIHVTSSDFPIDTAEPHVETARVTRRLYPRDNYRSRFSWMVGRIVHFTIREMQLMRWLRSQTRADVLHLQEWTPWMLYVVVRYAQRRSIAVVVTVHDVRPHAEGRPHYERFRQWFLRLGLRRVDHVFVHTGLNRDEIAKELGLEVSRIAMIPFGAFGSVRELGPVPEKIALFFGHWRSNKGLIELIRAADLLPEWTIVVAGQVGDLHYAQLCKNAAGDNVILRPGFVESRDVRRYFAGARVCVLPYQQFDSQSAVLHLAAGNATPVIVTPVGGLAAVVDSYECGLVAAGFDHTAIAEAIRKFEDEDLYRDCREGTLRLQDSMGWRLAATETVRVYAECRATRQDVDRATFR